MCFLHIGIYQTIVSSIRVFTTFYNTTIDTNCTVHRLRSPWKILAWNSVRAVNVRVYLLAKVFPLLNTPTI